MTTEQKPIDRFESRKTFNHYGFVTIPKSVTSFPRRQPCPTCHKSCHRVSRNIKVALYDCPTHGNFPISISTYIESVPERG